MAKAGWRQRKRQKKAVELTRKQLAIVQESIMALRVVLQSVSKDSEQILAFTNRLDSLLRRQDRLQRVLERARVGPEAPRSRPPH